MSQLQTLPETIALRPKQDSDDDFLRHAYETSRDDEFVAYSWEPGMREAFFRQQFDAQAVHFAGSYESVDYDIIELGGTPIGRLVLSWEADHLHCVDIVLLPEYRRNRLGSQIMQAIVDEADRRGISASLFYEKWKPYLGPFYQRYGFTEAKDYGSHCYLLRAKAQGSQ